MGTRNLTKVIDKDNVVRVAQYGQWDGYPEYTGTRILGFISEYRMLEQIEKALAKAEFVSEDYVDNAYNQRPEDFAIFYPSLTRDIGCDILKTLVYSNGTVPLVDNSDFENDDLFCEGVYTVDYQSNKFISKFGVTVEFPLDALPTPDEYLNAFIKQRELQVA